MSLGFPNRIRSYDARNKRVRFWGHDSAIEIAFFLKEDVLLFLAPGTAPDETAILRAFDANWSRIMEIAGRAYDHNHTHAHILAVKDFGG